MNAAASLIKPFSVGERIKPTTISAASCPVTAFNHGESSGRRGSPPPMITTGPNDYGNLADYNDSAF